MFTLSWMSIFAPALIRACTIDTCPLLAASIRAVYPYYIQKYTNYIKHFIKHLQNTRRQKMYYLYFLFNFTSTPTLFWISLFAPAFISTGTVYTFPLWASRIRAVYPNFISMHYIYLQHHIFFM